MLFGQLGGHEAVSQSYAWKAHAMPAPMAGPRSVTDRVQVPGSAHTDTVDRRHAEVAVVMRYPPPVLGSVRHDDGGNTIVIEEPSSDLREIVVSLMCSQQIRGRSVEH